MEIFDIQVLLKDGTFADYQVQNKRGSNTYNVYEKDKSVASFTSQEDGTWQISENASIDEDLQQRIINQLNGFKS